jgi:hypothetical protein
MNTLSQSHYGAQQQEEAFSASHPQLLDHSPANKFLGVHVLLLHFKLTSHMTIHLLDGLSQVYGFESWLQYDDLSTK